MCQDARTAYFNMQVFLIFRISMYWRCCPSHSANFQAKQMQAVEALWHVKQDNLSLQSWALLVFKLAIILLNGSTLGYASFSHPAVMDSGGSWQDVLEKDCGTCEESFIPSVPVECPRRWGLVSLFLLCLVSEPSSQRAGSFTVLQVFSGRILWK